MLAAKSCSSPLRPPLSCLLNPKNDHDSFWVDSAYAADCFENLLSLGGFESLIHEKGARSSTLSGAAQELNRVKSAIRACVEHVFGCVTMSMGGQMTRKIGLASTEAWWGLKNLAFNYLWYLQRTSSLAAAVSYWSRIWQSACQYRQVVAQLWIPRRQFWRVCNALQSMYCRIFRGALELFLIRGIECMQNRLCLAFVVIFLVLARQSFSCCQPLVVV